MKLTCESAVAGVFMLAQWMYTHEVQNLKPLPFGTPSCTMGAGTITWLKMNVSDVASTTSTLPCYTSTKLVNTYILSRNGNELHTDIMKDAPFLRI